MKPDLEVVQIGRAESFKAWEHGYPFRTVRWHFHPELELHHVVSTSGRYFVGDFIGTFVPGNLVLTGPNLPHNWVSDTAPGEAVPLRSRVVQFTEGFVADAMALMPELAAFARDHGAKPPRPALRPRDRRAGRPADAASSSSAQGIRRIELFWAVDRRPGPGARRRGADQRELPARPLGLHVRRHQRGAGLDQRQPDRALRRGRPRPHRRPVARRLLARLPPAHRAGAGAVRQPAADQPRLPAPDERRGDADHRGLLRVGLQQPLELQPAVPRATRG